MSDMSKLPKWARDKIQSLTIQRDNRGTQLSEILNAKPTRVSYRPTHELGSINIPDASKIQFRLGDRKIIEIGFDQDGNLWLRSINNCLALVPYSSNAVAIGEVDYPRTLGVDDEQENTGTK